MSSNIQTVVNDEKKSRKFSLAFGSIKDLPDWLRWKLTDGQRFLLLCIIAGIACGLAGVAFHVSIHWVYEHWTGMFHDAPWWRSVPIMLFSPAIAGILVGLILKYISPNAVGSGIPQTKQAFYQKFGVFELKEAFFRFIAGTLSVGLGVSLGREGPTVHICSAISSKIGQWFGLAKASVKSMVPVGMAAGISAAFNTPIAAIFFVFEELLDDFSSKALGGILVAVVIAAVVSRSILGEHAAFVLSLPQFHMDYWMLSSILMGACAGLFGHLFVGGLLRLRNWNKSWGAPSWIKPGVGGLGVGLIGVTVYHLSNGYEGVFSIGYQDLSSALAGELAIAVILLLFVGKFVATICAYSFGGSGGIFAPVLFLGGMLGGVFGETLSLFSEVPEGVDGACALLGMGAFFAAVIRCPLTSILIIFEMTRNYSIILPLMVGNMIAYAISAKLRPVAIYDALLLQDKVSLKKMPSYRGERDWRNLPVSTIMTHEAVSLPADKKSKEVLQEEIKKQRHHAYPVLESGGKLVGVITRHEIEDSVHELPDATIAELLPDRKLVYVHPDTSIRDVANKLVLGEVEQAPVVSVNDITRLIGIITLHDIARQQNAIQEKEDH